MKRRVAVARRLILLAPVVLGIVTVLFAAWSGLSTSQKLVAYYGEPSSPWTYQPTLPPGVGACPPPNGSVLLGTCSNPVYERDVAGLGLNLPLPAQWAIYLYHTLTLQWGTVGNHSSVAYLHPALRGSSVSRAVGELLPPTLELAGLALLLALPLSVELTARSRAAGGRGRSPGLRAFSFSEFLFPIFLLAALALFGVLALAAVVVGWGAHGTPWCPQGEPLWSEIAGLWPVGSCFGAAGYPGWMHGGLYSTPTGFPTVDALWAGAPWLALDSLVRLVLPALVVAFGTSLLLTNIARYRSAPTFGRDLGRTARALGFSERAVQRRWIRPTARVAALGGLEGVLGYFVVSLVVVEVIFGREGVGSLWAAALYTSAGSWDFGTLLGTTLTISLLTLALVTAASLVTLAQGVGEIAKDRASVRRPLVVPSAAPERSPDEDSTQPRGAPALIK